MENSDHLKARFAGTLIGLFYYVYTSTIRYKFEFEDEEDRKTMAWDLASKQPRAGKNCLYAFFHQDEYCLIPAFQDSNICVLVSSSKDGTMMDAAASNMGYQIVRGSSSRRAVAGFIEALKKVKAGHKFSIAVDGPRGPAFIAKDGITALSKKTGRPIFPLRAYPKPLIKVEKAWNKIKIPTPFCKVVVKIGKLKVYEREELEQKLLSL
jgi:lysophospholipid acyltransferase (LPLAT)-like uncharacterized protein